MLAVEIYSARSVGLRRATKIMEWSVACKSDGLRSTI